MPARSPRSSLPLLRRLVLDVFADGTVATRSDVTARTGLSRAVVTGLLNDLLETGDLIPAERDRPATGPGRPANAYRLHAHVAPVAVVHLARPGRPGRLVLADHDGPRAQVELDTAWTSDWAGWSRALHDALDALEETASATVRRVVLSAPFPVRAGAGAPPGDGRVAVPEWLRVDPRPAVSELLARPTMLVNDANLAALGEAHFGAGRGRRHVLHLSVRDGVGAGLVFDGEVFTGANGMAGELAHVQVAERGPYCVCGNRGCLATQTLSPFVVQALTSRYARPLTWDDVDRLVTEHDGLAVRFFTDLGGLVAQTLAPVLTVLDPDVVVVDAQLGSAATPFIDGLRTGLGARCIPSLVRSLDVVAGQLVDPIAWGAVAAADVAGDPARDQS